MVQISIIPIIFVSLLFLSLGFLIGGKSFLARRTIVIVLIIAIVLTFSSLLIKTGRYSGTGFLSEFGWPHVVYNSWKSLEGREVLKGFSFGPLELYFLSDVLFYFSFVVFLTGLGKRMKRKNLSP